MNEFRLHGARHATSGKGTGPKFLKMKGVEQQRDGGHGGGVGHQVAAPVIGPHGRALQGEAAAHGVGDVEDDDHPDRAERERERHADGGDPAAQNPRRSRSHGGTLGPGAPARRGWWGGESVCAGWVGVAAEWERVKSMEERRRKSVGGTC
jgi:hypothetical protein